MALQWSSLAQSLGPSAVPVSLVRVEQGNTVALRRPSHAFDSSLHFLFAFASHDRTSVMASFGAAGAVAPAALAAASLLRFAGIFVLTILSVDK